MEAERRKSKSVFGEKWVMWLDLNRESCEREWRNQPRKAGAGPISADLEARLSHTDLSSKPVMFPAVDCPSQLPF